MTWYTGQSVIGIPSFQLDRFQRVVINAAAWLVFQSSRHDHITPLLYRLHWHCAGANNVQACRVGVWVFLYGLMPAYRADVLHYSLSLDFLVDNACVRHRTQHWLYHWHGSLYNKGDRAFSVAAAKTWNSSQSELVTSSKCLWLNSRPICFPDLFHRRWL